MEAVTGTPMTGGFGAVPPGRVGGKPCRGRVAVSPGGRRRRRRLTPIQGDCGVGHKFSPLGDGRPRAVGGGAAASGRQRVKAHVCWCCCSTSGTLDVSNQLDRTLVGEHKWDCVILSTWSTQIPPRGPRVGGAARNGRTVDPAGAPRSVSVCPGPQRSSGWTCSDGPACCAGRTWELQVAAAGGTARGERHRPYGLVADRGKARDTGHGGGSASRRSLARADHESSPTTLHKRRFEAWWRRKS